ncbi:hypothetical protein WH52_09875 [Tenacibaculum holothuriorum]|uniref:Bulb-type lectin domain-containing protein n=1 Tax=Tenacibaculum holothuriorum TaxID=1635173 RepID=A0A1Y2PDH2_9FLAO|nr:hypothetical protein [Tenacibaculum holothuriorum]OSY87728.1 hypothetical protein WH52_09875 [Tenacibaculum holothuriorum]
MKFKSLILLLIFSTLSIYSQVKIGDNPSSIHNASILELESSDKVLVITRVSTAQMNAITPSNGALVYNTDTNCIYYYNTSWNSLCNSSTKVTTANTPPTGNNTGDFWIDSSNNNSVNLWNGTSWVSIDNNPSRGNGPPMLNTSLTPIAGDVYVDQSNGRIYAYNGTNWVAAGNNSGGNTNINATNGLNSVTNSSGTTIELGGVLIKPTIIETSAINTLAITGLLNGNTNEDDIVTVNRTTGVLRKVSTSNLLREEITEITATNGQLEFTGLNLRGATDKISVYRNGVRISFTIKNNTTIEIEPEAICYQGDQIRIVQFY